MTNVTTDEVDDRMLDIQKRYRNEEVQLVCRMAGLGVAEVWVAL